jgi:hypothetical protein
MTNLITYGGYSLEAVKAEQELAGATGTDFMKFEQGKNVVRFLPPPIGRATPFAVTYQHFVQLPGMSNNASFVCPRLMAKRTCPVCAEVDRLRATGNPADYDTAGGYMPRFRVFANVIDRKHPEMGPRVLAFGKGVKKDLDTIREDTDAGGDFCDPINGFDIIVNRTGQGKNDTEYSVRTSMRQSKLADSIEQMNDWIGTQIDVTRYARVPTPDELRKILSMQTTEAAASVQGTVVNPRDRAQQAQKQRRAQDDLEATGDEE